MSTGTLHVELAAPERSLVKLEAKEVILPGKAGVFAVRPEHTPLLTSLVPGVVIIHTAGGEEVFYALSGGFAEIVGDRVVVLAQTLEKQGDIDVTRAESARDRALERLGGRTTDVDVDITRAELALGRAMARLQAQNRHSY